LSALRFGRSNNASLEIEGLIVIERSRFIAFLVVMEVIFAPPTTSITTRKAGKPESSHKPHFTIYKYSPMIRVVKPGGVLAFDEELRAAGILDQMSSDIPAVSRALVKSMTRLSVPATRVPCVNPR
jgi:hypothetical protein